MADMFDYIEWRGDIPFSKMGVNPVDALVFSTLSYIDFEGIVSDIPDGGVSIFDAANMFLTQDDIKNRIRVKSDINLLKAAAYSERFGKSRITFYRKELDLEKETQFAAMTFLINDGTAVVTYRGTDFNLIGWKEDFNMTFQESIPAQKEALRYLNEYALKTNARLRLVGHSKGGNLAVYAAAKADEAIQNRTIEVYNQDGPGFTESLMGDRGYIAMVPKIKTLIPQSSIVGMLLEHEEPYIVIKSKSIGAMQHDPYSWEVMGPSFIYLEEVTEQSKFVDRALKKWLESMTKEERSRFADAVFDTLESSGASRTWDLLKLKHIKGVIKEFYEDKESRKIITDELEGFVKILKDSIIPKADS